MKKLKINVAAAILDIIGASFYLIALILAFITQYFMDYLPLINLIFMIIWCFSIAGSIVGLISLIKSKNVMVPLSGVILGFVGHLTYFLLSIYLSPASIVLCILGAIFTFKNNKYQVISVNEDKKAAENSMNTNSVSTEDISNTTTENK